MGEAVVDCPSRCRTINCPLHVRCSALLDDARGRRFNGSDRRNQPAIDGEGLQQAGADTAARYGPDQPFEVVTLPPIEPTLSVDAVPNGRASI